MKTIVIFGSGRSAPSLIKYLANRSIEHNWRVIIADKKTDQAEKYISGFQNCEVLNLEITDEESRNKLVSKADLVLSMVPVRFHEFALKSCLRYKVDLLTPSYETKSMKALETDIKRAGILVLNEMGLDPGLDHMSAMKTIDEIRKDGHHLSAFESFTGGLMAPGYDDNPWQYKFTWNPRNVVLAGQGGAVRFLHNGRHKYIPYTKVFRRTEKIEIEDYGIFEGYANRDSLDYLKKYTLEGVSTIYRGTLRRPGFCRVWDLFVQLGVTDDTYIVEDSESMTYREFINSFLPYNPTDSVELKLMQYLKIDHDSGLMEKLQSLNIFSKVKIGISKATPAKILEHILKQSWTMKPEDKDMIVMWHKFFYRTSNEKPYQKTSSLVVLGEDSNHTAMAKTVGLPMGIAAKLILKGDIKLKGLQLPVKKQIYTPVLKELQQFGIQFKEQIIPQKDNYENQPFF